MRGFHGKCRGDVDSIPTGWYSLTDPCGVLSSACAQPGSASSRSSRSVGATPRPGACPSSVTVDQPRASPRAGRGGCATGSRWRRPRAGCRVSSRQVEEVRRSEQPDAAAEVVRAVAGALPRRCDLMTASTPEMPPHLARSGWTTAEPAPDAIKASNAALADRVLAGGEGHRRGPPPDAAIAATADRLAAAPRSRRRPWFGEAPALRRSPASSSHAWLASTIIVAAPRRPRRARRRRVSASRASPKPTFSLNETWPAPRSRATMSPGRSGLMPLA